MSFEQLQSHLLKVAKEEYKRNPFPRFHLLSKAHASGTHFLCGKKDLRNNSVCDGYECITSSPFTTTVCWRFYAFHNHEFWAPCTWLRLEDAFGTLLRRGKMQLCSGYDMFRVAPRALNTKQISDQKSLWDAAENDEAEEVEALPAPRMNVVVSRIVRDTPAANALKELYDGQCQICGTTLHIGETIYSEAHYLRPLGAPHDGPDDWGNMMVLCPNHHTLFDYGVPIWHDENTVQIEGVVFVLRLRHKLDAGNIGYYKQNLQIKKYESQR